MLKSNFFEEISLLGLGAMRLPTNDKGIDYDELNKMVDNAIAGGINYFDTAYVYHGGDSEIAIRKSLVERYNREQFRIANKLSIWCVKDEKDLDRMIDEQLEKVGVDYFDYYLLHSIDKSKLEDINNKNAFDFMKKVKAEGKAKHIGFSFHDTPDVLEQILSEHPEMEFVQLQINYLDWDVIQSKECYEIARKYNKPIIVMESIKGGTLATMPKDIEAVMKDTCPDKSVVSWALRFLIEKEGIMAILSGMSNNEQIMENIATFENKEPFTAEERKTLDDVLVMLSKISSIPCTGCKYCIDCPKGINIPSIFATYNQFKRNPENGWNAKMMYRTNIETKATECVACGKCESHCPQFIKIIEELKVCHKTLT